MSAIRPLPARPNLEFEHKRAKELLKSRRAAEPDLQLADVQLGIAREYGFASWPKLVRYFEAAQRQAHSKPSLHGPEFYESSVANLLTRFNKGMPEAARVLSTFVPRLYGSPIEEVLQTSVTDDEARHATARANGFPSWQELLQRHAEFKEARDNRLPPARHLIKRGLHGPVTPDALERIKKDPELLQDLLCGIMRMEPEKVQLLLDLGADPDWVSPGGISVLEIAIIRYWSGDAVDVLAARAKRPRRALWIAAGLGDVDGVRTFIDRSGKPIGAAREDRPDFIAADLPGAPQYWDASDEEILMEAFWIATTNERTHVMDYLASVGLDVNSLVWQQPVLNVAAGNGFAKSVACLMRLGANPDLKGRHPDMTAREMAREVLEQSPSEKTRHIVELLGLDPDRILAERDARPVPEPEMMPDVMLALELAGDDAARQGRSSIGAENLLWGLLRDDEGAGAGFFIGLSRMRAGQFRDENAPRLLPRDKRIERAKLTLDDEAQAIMRDSIARAKHYRREGLTGGFVLMTLLRNNSYATELLTRYGGNAEPILNMEEAL